MRSSPMDYALTIVFWCNTVFAAWVVFRNGAEWLQAWLPPQVFADRHGVPWTVKRLRAFVGVAWGINAWALWLVLEA